MNSEVNYETGVVWQDYQHKQLIDLFEKVKEAKSDKRDKNIYRYTLAFLAMYVNHHFKLEEEYMERYTYPATETHRNEHKSFIKEIKAFRETNETYSEEAASDLLNKMGGWIINHIMADDQALGAFILQYENKKGSPV